MATKQTDTQDPAEENPEKTTKGFTRRDFLKGGVAIAAVAAIGGLAACTSTTTITSTTTVPPLTNTTTTTAPPVTSTTTTTAPPVTTTTTVTATVPDYFAFFDTAEAATIMAVCDRIIPGTDSDPGAVQAKAYIYIDRALIGYLADKSIAKGVPLPKMQTAYRLGLAGMDAYSQSKYGNNFAKLTTTQQDAVLTDMQSGKATGFTAPDAATFFNLLLTHVREGTFCDPIYGGNYNLVGWKMISFPGAQTSYIDSQMAIGFDQSIIPPKTLVDSEKFPEALGTGPAANF